MSKRKSGEGSWGTKIINGTQYITFQKSYLDVGIKNKIFYGKSAKEVKSKVQKFESGKIPVIRSDVSKVLLGDYIYEWLYGRKAKELSPSSFDTMESTMNNQILKSDIATLQFRKITPEVLEDFLESIAEEYSESTYKKVRSLLFQVFDYAYKIKDISINPMDRVSLKRIKTFGIESREKVYLTLEEVERIYKESKRLNNEQLHINGPIGSRVYGINADMLVFIAYTGLRVSEAKSITWADIDFTSCICSVNKAIRRVRKRDKFLNSDGYYNLIKSPKSAKGVRFVPLADTVIDLLHRLEESSVHNPDDYVFANKNGSVPMNNVNRTLKSMLKRAGVRNCTIHDLRRSFAAILLNEENVSITVIADILGHKSIETTFSAYMTILNKKKIESIQVFNHNKID